jgi:hypothetical protein
MGGHAIPVLASSGDLAPPVGALGAEVFEVTAAGQIVQELQRIPVQNGVAVYTGPQLPAGQFFAIRIRQVTSPGAVFRSGPLRRLPGPPSPVVSAGAISLVVGGGGFNLTSPGTEGAPERLVEHLRDLPAPLEFVGVRLMGDQDHNYVVALRVRVRIGFVQFRFTYQRAWRLAGNLDPGRPELPVLAEPFGTPTISSPLGLPFGGMLDRLMKDGIEKQLAAAMGLIGTLVLLSAEAPFGAQTVSVNTLEVFPRLDGGANASVSLGAGAITGLLVPPTPG